MYSQPIRNRRAAGNAKGERNMWLKLNKRRRIKDTYFASFITLVVVPILAIIIISMVIIRAILTDSAVRSIQSAQENMAVVLGNEVQDAALRLSHFIYVNNNEIIRMAAATDTDQALERYQNSKLLTESFNYAMPPVQDILSAAFYMKSGRDTYLKEELILSDEEIRTSAWYQEALDKKNMVTIGYYDKGITISRRNASVFTIVAAFAPNVSVDRDEVIEVVALFRGSQLGTLMREYNKEELLGVSVLLDQEGQVILDPSQSWEKLAQPAADFQMEQGQFRRRAGGREYVYIVTTEPVTGCRFVNIAEANVLTRRFNQVAVGILAVTVFLFWLFFMFSAYFLKNIVTPMENVVEGMKQVEQGELDVHIQPEGQAELRTMVHSFNHMVRRLKQLISENEEHQQKKHEAEIRALQSQINPHFLVNALSSIRFIAQVSHFDAIGKMAEALMKILTCSFRSNAGFYTFREELDVLDGFIYLMKIRYSDGFDIAYELEEGCGDCLVPRLILQPVVENSIVHGFSEAEDEIGQIWLRAAIRDGFLVITVEDNGKGMRKEELGQVLKEEGPRDGGSIGLFNVNSRLILNFGKDSGLVMESEEGKGTRTVIRIPVSREEHAHEKDTDR